MKTFSYLFSSAKQRKKQKKKKGVYQNIQFHSVEYCRKMHWGIDFLWKSIQIPTPIKMTKYL